MTSAQELFQNGGSLLLTKNNKAVGEREQIALVAVLLEASGRDGDYAPEEVASIVKGLVLHLAITEEQACKIAEMAEDSRQNRSVIETFYKVLRETYNTEQLLVILSMVWQIIIADGKVGTVERQFADSVRARLALDPEISHQSEKIARRSMKKAEN